MMVLKLYCLMLFWAVVPVLAIDLIAFFLSRKRYAKGLHRIVSFIRPAGIISLFKFSGGYFAAIKSSFGSDLNILSGCLLFGGFALIVFCYISVDIVERKLSK